jgi:hydroxylamine reductase (hybrid-cluster protein)
MESSNERDLFEIDSIIGGKESDNLGEEVAAALANRATQMIKPVADSLSDMITNRVMRKIREVARNRGLEATDEEIEDSDTYFMAVTAASYALAETVKVALDSMWPTPSFSDQ